MVFKDRRSVSTDREYGATRLAHRIIMSSWSCWEIRLGIWTFGWVFARSFFGLLVLFVSRDAAARPALFDAADCCLCCFFFFLFCCSDIRLAWMARCNSLSSVATVLDVVELGFPTDPTGDPWLSNHSVARVKSPPVTRSACIASASRKPIAARCETRASSSEFMLDDMEEVALETASFTRFANRRNIVVIKPEKCSDVG